MPKRGTLKTDDVYKLVKEARKKGVPMKQLAKKLGVSVATVYYHEQKAEGTLPMNTHQKNKLKGKRRKPTLPVMIEIPVVDEPISAPLTAFVGNVSSVTQAVKEMLNAN